MSQSFRIEKDSMGEVQVPQDAYYAAQTQRAVDNFPVSGLRLSRSLIAALGYIKQAAAKVNGELGHLPAEIAEAIQNTAGEVLLATWMPTSRLISTRLVLGPRVT